MTRQAEIEQRVLDFVRREVFRGQPGISVDTDWIAAGFDSLSLVSVLLFVEREYGIWMPAKDVKADVLKNVHSFSAHILKHLA
jgi:acyl carrier protein